jgi:hypothetical protein
MTKENKISGNSHSEWPFIGFDPTAMMQEFTTKMGEASVSVGNPAAGWLELQQHWMTFLSDRFKQDADLFHSLKACTNPSDMTEACSVFYKRAAEDYQSHIAKIFALGQQAMTGAAASGQARARPTGNGKA